MKTLTKIITALTAMIALVFFSGCEKQSPLATGDKNYRQDTPTGFTILRSTEYSLDRLFVEAEWITVQNGGTITVGNYWHGYSKIVFEPGDVSQDVEVTFSWESRGLLEGGAEFQPHGITFNNPVYVELSYKRADLEGISEDDLEIWYYNEYTNIWEPVFGNVDKSEQVVSGYLEHFSRYAIGAE